MKEIEFESQIGTLQTGLTPQKIEEQITASFEGLSSHKMLELFIKYCTSIASPEGLDLVNKANNDRTKRQTPEGFMAKLRPLQSEATYYKQETLPLFAGNSKSDFFPLNILFVAFISKHAKIDFNSYLLYYLKSCKAAYRDPLNAIQTFQISRALFPKFNWADRVSISFLALDIPYIDRDIASSLGHALMPNKKDLAHDKNNKLIPLAVGGDILENSNFSIYEVLDSANKIISKYRLTSERATLLELRKGSEKFNTLSALSNENQRTYNSLRQFISETLSGVYKRTTQHSFIKGENDTLVSQDYIDRILANTSKIMTAFHGLLNSFYEFKDIQDDRSPSNDYLTLAETNQNFIYIIEATVKLPFAIDSYFHDEQVSILYKAGESLGKAYKLL